MRRRRRGAWNTYYVNVGFQWRVELLFSHKEEVLSDEDLENLLDLAECADPLCCFDYLAVGALNFLRR